MRQHRAHFRIHIPTRTFRNEISGLNKPMAEGSGAEGNQLLCRAMLDRDFGLPSLTIARMERHARSAVLDGEIVRLDGNGKTQFKDLLFRRGEPRFYAFDLLWVDGEVLRYLPLIERKLRLRAVVPQGKNRLLYCDDIEGDGKGLFWLACPWTPMICGSIRRSR